MAKKKPTKKSTAPALPKHLQYDFTVVGGASDQSCAQAAREAAALGVQAHSTATNASTETDGIGRREFQTFSALCKSTHYLNAGTST